MIVSLTKNQLNQIESFIDSLDPKKNKDNYFTGKCGEVAVHNYGLNNMVYNNLYGSNLFNSILKNTHKADLGHDLILQSFSNKYIKIFAQVKTIACKNGYNLCLSKNLYNNKLEYYNNIPQDIFIMVKKISLSIYDIIGFITYDNAIKFYKEDEPVKQCYCINENYLQPIEEIKNLFK